MEMIEFLGAMFGTRAIEITAAFLGLINVVLIIRRSIWNFPFGIAMVILYAWIFYEVRLYSDALLQIFYLIVQLLAIRWWLANRDRQGLVLPRNLPLAGMAAAIACAMTGTAVLGTVMALYTNADLPYWDALTTVLSIIAQLLLAWRYIQNWLVWIAVDAISIGIYMVKDLEPTATLYAIFLALAIAGLIRWQKALGEGKAVPA